MSKVYTLKVPDEVGFELEANDDVEIIEVHGETPSEKQAELQERMGISPDDGDGSATEAELADLKREQLRAFLRRERKDGIEK